MAAARIVPPSSLLKTSQECPVDPLICVKIKAPDPPTKFCIDSVTFTKIALYWSPPKDNGFKQLTPKELAKVDNCVYYCVQQADDTDLSSHQYNTVYEGPLLECTINSLKMSNEYKYRMRSYNIAGYSQWSSTLGIETSDNRIFDVSELHKAIKNMHLAWTRELIIRNPLLVHKIYAQRTALFTACAYGRPRIVEILLSFKPDLNFQDSEGISCLMKASTHGYTQCVEMLIKEGAVLHLESAIGMTALHYAAWEGHHTVVGLLLKAGIPVDVVGITDPMMQTPLQYSCFANSFNVRVVELLIKYKADIERRDVNGNTPLMLAVHHPTRSLENFWVIKELLKNRANPFARNHNGRHPLDLARELKKQKVVKLLEQLCKEYLQNLIGNSFRKALRSFSNTVEGQRLFQSLYDEEHQHDKSVSNSTIPDVSTKPGMTGEEKDQDEGTCSTVSDGSDSTISVESGSGSLSDCT